jgi:hypothetical protein
LTYYSFFILFAITYLIQFPKNMPYILATPLSRAA